MKNLLIALLFSLLFCGLVTAQENQSPYDIALERILEAEASGASNLFLDNLGLTELPPEIGSLINLQWLDLRNNQLSSLPFEIGNLSNLQMLFLGENQLSSLPAEIGNLSNLQEFSLYGNQLSSLPAEIGNLNNLHEFYVSNNQLSSLPPEIGNLGNLIYLILSENQLNSLPAEIGNLSNLQMLFLGENQLSSLPAEIGNLDALCLLVLQNNAFETLPPELAPLKRLGTDRGCGPGHDFGLHIDDSLLDGLPNEVASGGTPAILEYLRNEAWWHLQRLIVSGASAMGLMAAIILSIRWRNNRGKQKRKPNNH